MFNAISTKSAAMGFPLPLEGVEGRIAQNPLESPLAKRMGPLPPMANGNLGLPKDVINLIFGRLPPEMLLTVGLVCRLWYQLASSDSLWMSFRLQEVFSEKVELIDRKIWEGHINVEKYKWDMTDPGRPCVDKWDYIQLKRIESAVEGGLGITIIWLFKGHKLNDTIDFARTAKAGNSTQFKHIWPPVVQVLGEQKVEESVVLAVTNNIFKKSRNKTVAEQQKRVKELKCEMPGILATIDVALMKFRISKPAELTRLFGNDPSTFTRLEENIEGEKLIFGDFAPGGPSISYDFDFNLEHNGMAGVWKFKISKN